MNNSMPQFNAMMPDAVRTSMMEQGERVLETTKKATDWQIEQAKKVEKMMMDQGAVAFDLGIKAYAQAAHNLLDMQRKMLDVMVAKADTTQQAEA